MRIHSLLLPIAAVGGACWLLATPQSQAFSTLGGSLGLTQRDFRVFDNFTDATANNNTTADANFPGYTGVEMAAWKGIVEWGSELHGNGNGDSTQVGGLGSGGANFDASWQGNATAVGGINDNVMSELTGSSGGVLAFTEGPDSNGWRQRYYSTWTWQDGPGSVASGIDIQGVVCHEYGHSLGLGHSDAGGATMQPAISGTGTSQRSISADDIAGVQAIYGVKSGTKPKITSVTAIAGAVTINGTNFAAANNEVWFTQKTQGGNGNPIKVLSVASTNGGTKITLNAPSTAGKGDVLVKSSAGSTGAFLSNAWPIDPGTTSGGGPNITAITPSSIDAVTPDPLSVVIDGTTFTGVNNLTINGVTVPASNYTVTDTQITILAWPLQNALGDATIFVSSGAGSDTGIVSVNECDPPVLDMDPSAPFAFINGNTVTFTAGSEVGDVVYIVASTTQSPTTIPGLMDISIGAGLTDLLLLKTLVVPAKGWTQYSAPITGIPPGTIIYTELLAFPNEVGPDLVEDSDPAQAVLVLL